MGSVFFIMCRFCDPKIDFVRKNYYVLTDKRTPKTDVSKNNRRTGVGFARQALLTQMHNVKHIVYVMILCRVVLEYLLTSVHNIILTSEQASYCRSIFFHFEEGKEVHQESLGQRISRELRWLREQDDCLTLEYVASCSGVPQSTVHRAIQGNVRLQRRTVSKLVEFIDKETKGKISTHYLLNANGFSAEVLKKGKNCEHMDQDYSGLNLSSSDHSKSVFTRCNFSRANLTRAIFRGANFVNCTFDDAQMMGADLSRTTVEGCTFFRADGSMSKWTDAYITESNFRDFIHTGINFTRLKTGKHVRWLSDSYKGGFIGKDADFSGFCWFPHTHAFASELFLQNAANRPEWKMLAGGVDINARGADMCWLGLIWYINTHFSYSEQGELWSVLLQNPAWGFNWHLKLERDIKYPFLVDLYGENYSDWPDLLTLYAQLENREFQLDGVQYKFTRLAHAVPLGVCPPEEEKQLFLKPKTLKCRLEEILFEQFQTGVIN